MGAYSVTGVSGAGVAKLQKGPGNGRNQYVPLVSALPGIVAAGTVTAGGGGDLTVTLSGMDAAAASYVVLAQGQVTAATAVVKSKANDGTTGLFASFVITAGAAGAIGWVVVKLAV